LEILDIRYKKFVAQIRQAISVVSMGNTTRRERDGGQEFHVGDCYVWAEIHYLDSPTDYREYIPENVLPAQSGIRGEPMVLLDNDSPGLLRSSFVRSFLFWSFIAGLIILMLRAWQD
jgi:hypothetical protein